MERFQLNFSLLLVIFLGASLVSTTLAFPAEAHEHSSNSTGAHNATGGEKGKPEAVNNTSSSSSTTEEPMVTTTGANSGENGTTTPSPLTLATKVEDCNSTVCEDKICRIHRGSISRPSFYARCPQPHVDPSGLILNLGSGSESSSTEENTTSSSVGNETPMDLTKYCMCSSAYHVAATSDMHEQSYVQVTVPPNCQLPTPAQDKLCEQKACQGDSKKLKSTYICEHEEKFYCACFN